MGQFLHYFFNPTTLTLIIGGILTSLFGFLAGVSKEDQTPRWITWGSFIAGLIVLDGGIYSGYQGHITEKLLNDKTDQISKLSIENSELNKQIASSITGGDSYCYFLLVGASDENLVDLFLITEGENPLYDVEIKINDMDQRAENAKNMNRDGADSNMSMPDFLSLINKSAKIIKVGNISPIQGYLLGTLSLPVDTDMARYEIEIMARNGRVIQIVQFRRIVGKWIRAEKVYFQDKVVRKYLDPNFPRDDWSETFWEE